MVLPMDICVAGRHTWIVWRYVQGEGEGLHIECLRLHSSAFKAEEKHKVKNIPSTLFQFRNLWTNMKNLAEMSEIQLTYCTQDMTVLLVTLFW